MQALSTERILLFHTGFQIIEKPEVNVGRKNADFGPGFYLSGNREFSKRWARERKGLRTYLNTYELDTTGLAVKRFCRDTEWLDYITANRLGRADSYADYDVIIGPIANDTLFDTWGIITSNLLEKEQSLQLLKIGPVYEQTVIKTEKAAAMLQFKDAVQMSSEEIAGYRETLQKEELEFQNEFLKQFEEMQASEE